MDCTRQQLQRIKFRARGPTRNAGFCTAIGIPRRVLSRTRGAFGSGAAAVESAADSVFARSCGRVGVLVGLDGCEVLLSLIRVLVCALVGPASRARVRCPGCGSRSRSPRCLTGSTVYRFWGGTRSSSPLALASFGVFSLDTTHVTARYLSLRSHAIQLLTRSDRTKHDSAVAARFRLPDGPRARRATAPTPTPRAANIA